MAKKKKKKDNVDSAAVRKDRMQWVQDMEDTVERREESSGKRGRRRKVQPLHRVCPFCESHTERISYKQVYQLERYINKRGWIVSSSRSGVCEKHQKQLAKAIKRARYVGLLPYVKLD